MDSLKEIRWKQRFQNFEKSYRTLETYVHRPLTSELERAGLVHLFEVTFELAWKVLKDYLESEGLTMSSPRETLKTAFQAGILEDGHVFIDALSHRNLAAHTYDEAMATQLVTEIKNAYFPALRNLYERLREEI